MSIQACTVCGARSGLLTWALGLGLVKSLAYDLVGNVKLVQPVPLFYASLCRSEGTHAKATTVVALVCHQVPLERKLSRELRNFTAVHEPFNSGLDSFHPHN